MTLEKKGNPFWGLDHLSGTTENGLPKTGLPIFPLKASPPPRDTHLSWAKVRFKTAEKGNIET